MIMMMMMIIDYDHSVEVFLRSWLFQIPRLMIFYN